MVGMSLYDASGNTIAITGLDPGIEIAIPNVVIPTGDQANYKCKYYDTATSTWSTNGVTSTYDAATSIFTCTTTHLTDFAVLFEEDTARVINGVQYVQNVALSQCPNSCSGHGSCSAFGFCHCYARAQSSEHAWTQHDCSEKTCPKSLGWMSRATSDSGDRRRIECSGKGMCDRKSGECKCFDGYDGKACSRTICRGNCNNRGRCVTQEVLAYEASKTYSSPWDALKHVGCVCDLGARGPDCSLEECPSGSDVLLGKGNNFGRDCSGRGICDYSNGICKCFQGFFGTRCQSQTILS